MSRAENGSSAAAAHIARKDQPLHKKVQTNGLLVLHSKMILSKSHRDRSLAGRTITEEDHLVLQALRLVLRVTHAARRGCTVGARRVKRSKGGCRWAVVCRFRGAAEKNASLKAAVPVVDPRDA